MTPATPETSTSLLDLAKTWQQRGLDYAANGQRFRSTTYLECAAELTTLAAGLERWSGPVFSIDDRPAKGVTGVTLVEAGPPMLECGEGALGFLCGQPVTDGVCPEHGEVGPPVLEATEVPSMQRLAALADASIVVTGTFDTTPPPVTVDGELRFEHGQLMAGGGVHVWSAGSYGTYPLDQRIAAEQANGGRVVRRRVFAFEDWQEVTSDGQ